MRRNLKTGILLLAIGFTATMGLVVITGKQAVASNEMPNPAYGFGSCIYQTGGQIESCYRSMKQFIMAME